MRTYREVTDEEWRVIAPLLPENRPRRDLRGRPLSNTRAVINGVLWVITTETSWSALPRSFPPYQTCHRRFKAWHDEGVLESVITKLFGDDAGEVYALVLKRMRQGSPKRAARPAKPVANGVAAQPKQGSRQKSARAAAMPSAGSGGTKPEGEAGTGTPAAPRTRRAPRRGSRSVARPRDGRTVTRLSPAAQDV